MKPPQYNRDLLVFKSDSILPRWFPTNGDGKQWVWFSERKFLDVEKKQTDRRYPPLPKGILPRSLRLTLTPTTQWMGRYSRHEDYDLKKRINTADKLRAPKAPVGFIGLLGGPLE